MKKITILLAFAFIGLSAKAQWTPVNSGMTNHSISQLAVNGSTLFASTSMGIYKSNNNGISWTSANTGMPNNIVQGFAVIGTNLFAGTNGSGVYVTSNNGNNWTAMNNGLSNLDVWSMTASGTNLYAATSGGVFLSTNNGGTWSSINTGLAPPVFSIYVDGMNIYAGCLNGMYLSIDNGNSWTSLNTGQTNPVFSIDKSGSKIFAGTTPFGMYSSTNGGSSWTLSNNGLTNDTVSTFLNSGSNIFAGTTGGGVCLTTNNGANWTPLNTGLLDLWIHSIVQKGTLIFAGTDGAGVFSRPLSQLINCVAYYTTTYDSISNNFTLFVDSTTAANATSYHWDFGDGTTSNQAYPSHTYTSDTVYNVCMKIHTVSGDSCEYCHIIGKDYLGNIYRTAGFTINVHNPNSSVGVNENKFDNSISIYPNPATTETTITFSEAQKSTSIKVMNTLGECIQQLTTSNKQLILDMSGYAKGIYFVRIENEKGIVNRKIIVQ